MDVVIKHALALFIEKRSKLIKGVSEALLAHVEFLSVAQHILQQTPISYGPYYFIYKCLSTPIYVMQVVNIN